MKNGRWMETFSGHAKFKVLIYFKVGDSWNKFPRPSVGAQKLSPEKKCNFNPGMAWKSSK